MNYYDRIDPIGEGVKIPQEVSQVEIIFDKITNAINNINHFNNTILNEAEGIATYSEDVAHINKLKNIHNLNKMYINKLNDLIDDLAIRIGE